MTRHELDSARSCVGAGERVERGLVVGGHRGIIVCCAVDDDVAGRVEEFPGS